MALSDVIKKIEDSPRSTKISSSIAGVAVGIAAIAFCTMANQNNDSASPEPAEPIVKVAPTTAAATFAAPSPTPEPEPTSMPDPTATPKPQPTIVPTETPLPTATVAPDVSDYFVVLDRGDILDDGYGLIKYYNRYSDPQKTILDGPRDSFYNEAFYVEYLTKKGVMTSKQKDAYFNGEPIKIPLTSISTATYWLFKNDPHSANNLGFRNPELLISYADKASSGFEESALDDKASLDEGSAVSLEDGGGYITIDDGKVSVSKIDGEGNTTTVSVQSVGIEDLLEYWLLENKITIEQMDAYGRTGKIQLDLKDAADLFEFGYSSNDGIYAGIDQEAIDIAADNILQLISSD